MSCLTKKSFFFMVLSIVCNPTFADDIADCEFNVHLVFPNARYTRLALNNSATSQYTLALYNSAKFPETYLAFNFSMFALSLKVIDSMTTTEALSDDLLRQFDRFKNTFGEDEVRFLSVIGNYVRIENVEITKSKKSDISGYLDGLTNNLYAIYGDFQTRVKSPAKFCEEDYTDDEDECRKALKHMLKKKDDDEFNEMRADQAFRHCYLNYRYLDFFGKSIFSESGSSSSSSSSSSSTTISHYHRQPQNIGLVFSESGSSSTTISHNQQKIQLGIMKHYFELSMTTMNVMAKEKLEEDYPLFPSVEDYCFYKR